MRKLLLLALTAGALAACSREASAPAQTDDIAALVGSDLAVLGSFGAEAWAAGAGPDALGGVGTAGWVLRALPPELKLTDAQVAQIRTLVEAFQKATQADREALGAIRKKAEEARRAGATREQVAQILATGRPIIERIAAAEARLHHAVLAVLTDRQRAWLASHSPRRCDAPAIKLTDEQKSQISTLVAAFESANRADLDAVKAAMDAAAAAHKAGQSREEIRAILEAVKPARERLELARRALNQQIVALLTPEQKASGCYLKGATTAPPARHG
jgi:Spy/CpxP family protein refolding chaperone